MRAGGYRLFSAEDALRFFAAAPWAALQTLALVAGLVCLLPAARRAPAASALRLSPFLAAPLLLGYAVLAYAKPPAPPEYVVDMAPALGLAIAVATSKVLCWRGWMAAPIVRHARPAVLRFCLVAACAVPLALPFDPWAKGRKPLPPTYCGAADYWLQRLPTGATALDTIGLCGFRLLDRSVRPHPPFTFAPMWLRQLTQPWVGVALDGDGSVAAAAERLRSVLAPGSSAGVILADGQLLQELRERGWQRDLHRHWRMSWFQRVAGIETGERFARLAILVRRS